MKYNAKILLLGEHTVIKGSQALAMPITNHFGSWQYAVDSKEKQSLQQKLPQLLQYLNEQSLGRVLDLGTFSKELHAGLYFQSSIPTGYGMGSSGALCAGIVDRYQLQLPKTYAQLKQLFGQMESFFHGTSSGMDPLVCYLNYPVLFSSNGDVDRVSLEKLSDSKDGTDPAIFLLDTYIQRETAPYVNGFLKRCEKATYNNQCKEELVPLVNQAIQSAILGNWKKLYQSWEAISYLQYDLFDFMIPENFKPIWQEGLDGADFKLKICGAGGGGFLLGICNDFKEMQQASSYSLIRIM